MVHVSIRTLKHLREIVHIRDDVSLKNLWSLLKTKVGFWSLLKWAGHFLNDICDSVRTLLVTFGQKKWAFGHFSKKKSGQKKLMKNR
jgi:hypothetical protein